MLAFLPMYPFEKNGQFRQMYPFYRNASIRQVVRLFNRGAAEKGIQNPTRSLQLMSGRLSGFCYAHDCGAPGTWSRYAACVRTSAPYRLDLAHIAVAHEPREAIPPQGTRIGTAPDHLAMNVVVNVAAQWDAGFGVRLDSCAR
jgi:hypothetical protein